MDAFSNPFSGSRAGGFDLELVRPAPADQYLAGGSPLKGAANSIFMGHEAYIYENFRAALVLFERNVIDELSR